jgi:hypothetical protein
MPGFSGEAAWWICPNAGFDGKPLINKKNSLYLGGRISVLEMSFEKIFKKFLPLDRLAVPYIYQLLWRLTPGCWRRFASPNKGLRSKTRAGKLWVEHGVGASEATDLAMRNPSRPAGGVR